MGGLSTSQRAACEELALAPASLFALAHRFLPPEGRDHALALEALFRAVGDIPRRAADPGVGLAKLAWWRNEVLQAPLEGSQHPVVTALLDTGGLAVLSGDAWDAYIGAVAFELDESNVVDLPGLGECMHLAAGCEVIAFTGLPREHPAMDRLKSTVAASRLLEFVRALRADARDARRLPREFTGGGEPVEVAVAQAGERLTELARQWLPDPAPDWAQLLREGGEPSGITTLAIRDAVTRRRLRARAGPGRASPERARRPVTVGELLCAWRVASRLRRQAAGPG